MPKFNGAWEENRRERGFFVVAYCTKRLLLVQKLIDTSCRDSATCLRVEPWTLSTELVSRGKEREDVLKWTNGREQQQQHSLNVGCSLKRVCFRQRPCCHVISRGGHLSVTRDRDFISATYRQLYIYIYI